MTDKEKESAASKPTAGAPTAGAPTAGAPTASVPTASAMGLDAKAKGEVQLNPLLFGLTPRADILHSMVRWQLAKRRAGTHRTKPRAEIHGSGRKAWRQKGSGRARHGNRKSNIFRGGGKAHGPVVRSHAHGLPKKMRRLALRHALSAKCRAGELMILDAAQSENGKTAVLASQLKALRLEHALIVDGRALEPQFCRAAANIPHVDVLPAQGINVYDILRHKWLVLTRPALAALDERLGAAS